MEDIKKRIHSYVNKNKDFKEFESTLNLFALAYLKSGKCCLSDVQIKKYATGQITAEERRLLDRHFDVCLNCREKALQQQNSLGAIKAMAQGQASQTTQGISIPEAQSRGGADRSEKTSFLPHAGGKSPGLGLRSKTFFPDQNTKKRKKTVSNMQPQLTNLEHNLKKNIVHQDHVIEELLSAVQASYCGLASSDAPRGIFMFMGPTGTGKTFTAKKFAECLFGDASHLIHENLSYYNSPADIYRLFGPPPGYIGYGDKNNLLSRVKGKGEGVILLDEVEKANPIIWDTLLGILDEGGKTTIDDEEVDFTKFFIIMTTNAGAQIFCQKKPIGFVEQEKPKTQGKEIAAIKKMLIDSYSFKPEFLSRIQHFCLFNPFTPEAIERLAELEFKKFKVLLKKNEGKELAYNKNFIKVISRSMAHEQDARQVFRTVNAMIKEPIIKFKTKNEKKWKDIKRIALELTEQHKKKSKPNVFVVEKDAGLESFLSRSCKGFSINKIETPAKPKDFTKTNPAAVIFNLASLKNSAVELFEMLQKIKNNFPDAICIVYAPQEMGQSFALRCLQSGIQHYLTAQSFNEEIVGILGSVAASKPEAVCITEEAGALTFSLEKTVLRCVLTPLDCCAV